MQKLRIFCLVLVSLLAISPAGAVFAQEEPEYALTMTPADGLYSTIMIAGRDKDIRVDLENIGDEAVTKIALNGELPAGWTIKFDPPRMATLAAFDSERIYASVSAPEDTLTGDYFVTLWAEGDQASTEKIEIRVTVRRGETAQTIEVRAIHPSVEAVAGNEFVFEIEFRYVGQMLGDPKSFDLVPTAPQDWEVYFTPQFEKEKHISAIDLKPGSVAYSDKTRMVARAPFWPLPEPRDYTIVLDVVSEDMKDTLEVTAVITASYMLILAPAGERYDTKAKAGRDNYFSLNVVNLGTAPIDKITFISEKPAGWTVEFAPDQVDSLEALDTQTVDINIKPPPETIAGDYIISLRASGVQRPSEKMNIRVTVETPTVWGWVGVIIIAIVVLGLVVIFMRFSRR
ncbi:MAG: NEW3 domain-containing protein [Dehalococcoidales bacterium]